MRTTLALLALFLASLLPAPAAAERLPRTVVPDHYDLAFTIDLNGERFSGEETISVRVGEPTSRVVLNAVDLDLSAVTIATAGSTRTATVLQPGRRDRDADRPAADRTGRGDHPDAIRRGLEHPTARLVSEQNGQAQVRRDAV